MSTITMFRNLDSEMLHLPELRPFVGHRVEIVVRDSEPTATQDAARRELLTTLQQTCEQCQHANWDGAEAEAISAETQDVARRLLESLPSDIHLPTISAEPDGQLNFEWYQAPRRLLSVSITANGTLYWAALIGSEDPRGSCQFADQFPPTLLYWIAQVYE